MSLLACFYQGQTPFDLVDTEMYKYLNELKKRQNKEEVMNRRQAEKRAEMQDRHTDAETPTKVKRVELEIEAKDEKKEESIGKFAVSVGAVFPLSFF